MVSEFDSQWVHCLEKRPKFCVSGQDGVSQYHAGWVTKGIVGYAKVCLSQKMLPKLSTPDL